MYPLSALPYPTRQRLRELARPRELYNLQLADVDNIIKELNPIQVIKTYDRAVYEFRYFNGRAQAQVKSYKTIKPNKKLLYKPEISTFVKVGPSFFKEPLLQHFLFESTEINLHICEIEHCLTSSLQTLTTNIPKIVFYHCNINADVTLASLIAAFPITTNFVFLYCNFKENFLVDLKNVLGLSRSFRTVDIHLTFIETFLPCLSEKSVGDIMEFMKLYNEKNPFFLNLLGGCVGFYKAEKKLFAPWLKQVYGPAISLRQQALRMSSLRKFKINGLFRHRRLRKRPHVRTSKFERARKPFIALDAIAVSILSRLQHSLQNPTMTYPLSKLPYSSQRRLRELARPCELYNLQLADIDMTLHLNPLQQIAESHYWISYFEDGLYHYNEYYKAKIHLDPETLMKVDGVGIYRITEPPFFHQPELLYIINNVPDFHEIDIRQCAVTNDFMDSLKNWIQYLFALSFYNSTIHDRITALSLIAAYPDTKYIDFFDCIFPESFFADFKDVLKMKHSHRKIKIVAKDHDWLTKGIAADIIEVIRNYDDNSLITLHIGLTNYCDSGATTSNLTVKFWTSKCLNKFLKNHLADDMADWKDFAISDVWKELEGHYVQED
uniref:F-box domain-containing protein n=1 Tax=Panagrellus redivivus TaxID=6233 RepID=A0A7E4VBJ4_PANRE